MKNFIGKTFVRTIAVILVIAATAGIIASAKKSIVDNATDNAKSLVDAVSDVVSTKPIVNVTSVEIKHELKAIGEIATYKLDYAGTDTIESHKEKLGHKIPGSTYKIELFYNGTVKAGYNFEDIDVAVDNSAKKINIKLPEEMVINSNVDLQTLKQIEDTSFTSKILNPVASDTVTTRIAEIEQAELEKAINEDNIYELAFEHAKTLITNSLSSFTELGYEVIVEG